MKTIPMTKQLEALERRRRRIEIGLETAIRLDCQVECRRLTERLAGVVAEIAELVAALEELPHE